MSDIDIVTRLRAMGYAPYHEHQVMQEAADEIERLRGMLNVQNEQVQHYVAERDEARVEVCRLIVAGDFSVHENVTKEHVAYERGWDCFEEAP